MERKRKTERDRERESGKEEEGERIRERRREREREKEREKGNMVDANHTGLVKQEEKSNEVRALYMCSTYRS